ncbi:MULTISPECIES: GntR family transcriptional regulator [Streptomyces]|uniref:GntR family transcriptional regulator n=1 Tax=Streptomyces TaxID=1883 RepID=UPI00226D85C4|nr:MULTISPECIES: GntR family transcriptional regulator [unclassified Streptomyces]MCY0941448.1 GntR family transcriptional regulator [Streptomyces sp. H34-AA3]MCY0949160.1 GntR family transcriptional regulator [Streptomyces sp. H27-S2]MCZ4084855.1 GntR family transcriptional regulator [Streptomyces sp. H34-S5]
MGTTQLETAPEPKYWHLKTVLSEALDQDFAVGEVLPNERELAARFGVARATLRQALEQLELEGRLQRRRGVGTTVAPPRVGVAVGSPQHSWPGESVDGWEPVDAVEGLPPAAVLALLRTGAADGAGFAADEPVQTVRRTRVTQGQAVASELLYVPAASVPGLPAIEAPAGPARARAVLRELQRLALDGQDRSVELGSARADDARELDRLPGAPVLLVTTRYFTAAGTAAVSVATYRADTCRLTFGDSGDVEITHEPRVAS